MRRVGGLLVPLVALALLTGACSDDGDPAASPEPERLGTSTTRPERPTSTTEGSTTTTAIPQREGGPLEVVEQGFSLFPDPVDRDATLGGFGVVLLNPDPELLASGVTVTTRLLDAAGAELASDTTLLNGIQPGERMAVGRTLIEPIEEPASLDVAVRVAAWLRPLRPGAAMTAESIDTEAVDDGGMVTTFTVGSAWPRTEEGVDVTAVYRGTDGRILGAEMTTIEEVRSNDIVRDEITLLAPIPDLGRTDVYVGRGFAAHSTG